MSIEEAWRALAHAREEFERFKENGDPLLLRDACEKAWLAVLLATDLLLVRSVVGMPSIYAERKAMLRRLVAGRAKLAELRMPAEPRSAHLGCSAAKQESLRILRRAGVSFGCSSLFLLSR
ncbi:MAG: hypothetical protein QXI76_04220 [Thermofilum sp.]